VELASLALLRGEVGEASPQAPLPPQNFTYLAACFLLCRGFLSPQQLSFASTNNICLHLFIQDLELLIQAGLQIKCWHKNLWQSEFFFYSKWLMCLVGTSSSLNNLLLALKKCWLQIVVFLVTGNLILYYFSILFRGLSGISRME
jgi:hypothetical protein